MDSTRMSEKSVAIVALLNLGLRRSWGVDKVVCETEIEL